jgi:periplasmic copper chaperone A
MRFIALLLACLPGWAIGQVEIEKPWTRATPPGINIAAGYMTIRNNSAAADRLVSVSSPAAAKVETHVHIKDGDIVRMREVKGYEVPAKGVLELKPGGAHLMFVDLKRPFKDGETVPATLKFEKGGELAVQFHVGRVGASGGHKH